MCGYLGVLVAFVSCEEDGRSAHVFCPLVADHVLSHSLVVSGGEAASVDGLSSDTVTTTPNCDSDSNAPSGSRVDKCIPHPIVLGHTVPRPCHWPFARELFCAVGGAEAEGSPGHNVELMDADFFLCAHLCENESNL
jgi:hypothetical protein